MHSIVDEDKDSGGSTAASVKKMVLTMCMKSAPNGVIASYVTARGITCICVHARIMGARQVFAMWMIVTIPGICAGRPDRPGRSAQTRMQSMARATTRQRQYDESMFSARLAEALRRHRVAVRTTCTSSSVMRNITDQLARLASRESKDNSSNEDVLDRHGRRGLECPPRC
jgi:hypothetical protein